MTILYVITACCLLTWFRWRQELRGRSYPFVGISCLYGIWLLANGETIPMDGITVSVLALTLWMAASLLWAEKKYCIFELFVFFSYFMLFLAARNLPLELIMWILLPNASIFAALQLYYQRDGIRDRSTFPVFGNSNHNATFLLLGFYAALWLVLNGTYSLIVFVFLIGIALIRSRCRGAILALFFSMIFAVILIKSEILFYITGILIVPTIFNIERFYKPIRGILTETRMEIYKDAIKRIHPRYIVGRGLNYFADTEYGRVHNDHIEIIGEIGIIGYLLFLNIFSQLGPDKLIFCMLIAFFISGMFFYPLRQEHLAAPFWAMLGASIGISGSIGNSFFVLKIIGILSIIAIMIFTFSVFCNLLDWTVAQNKENKI